MPAILMTQSRRGLTNPGPCHHFLPQEVCGWGTRGLCQVDKIKGLGTSPLSFLLVFPLGIISRNVLVILLRQWLVLFGLDNFLKSVDKTLPKGPSKLWGLFLYMAALILHYSSSRHSQNLRFSLSRLIHLLYLIRTQLLLLTGPGTLHPGATPAPKGDWEAL